MRTAPPAEHGARLARCRGDGGPLGSPTYTVPRRIPMPRATTARTKRPTLAQLAPLASRQATAAPLLPQPLIERLLAVAMEKGGEFAEVYVERAQTTAVVLEEARIKSAQAGVVQGVG